MVASISRAYQSNIPSNQAERQPFRSNLQPGKTRGWNPARLTALAASGFALLSASCVSAANLRESPNNIRQANLLSGLLSVESSDPPRMLQPAPKEARTLEGENKDNVDRLISGLETIVSTLDAESLSDLIINAEINQHNQVVLTELAKYLLDRTTSDIISLTENANRFSDLANKLDADQITDLIKSVAEMSKSVSGTSKSVARSINMITMTVCVAVLGLAITAARAMRHASTSQMKTVGAKDHPAGKVV